MLSGKRSIRCLRSNFFGTHASSVLICAGARRRRAYHFVKLALKYGITVTLVIAVWVALKHFVLHLAGPSAQLADLAIFNFAAIFGLTLGIKARRRANGDSLTFSEGFKTGISIAISYAILTSLYFVVLLASVGPKLMKQQGEMSIPKAFIGVSIFFALLGTVFSALISLLVRKSPLRNR